MLEFVLSAGLAGCGSKGLPRILDASTDRKVTVAEVNDGPVGRDTAKDVASKDAGNEVADAKTASDVSDSLAEVSSVRDAFPILDAAPVDAGPSPADAPPRADVPAAPVDAGDDTADLAPLAAPECFDDNPCTSDVFDGQACQHTPVADGTPCTDGNTCTLGDKCQAGLCVAGEAQHGSLSELGRIEAFGSASGAVISTGEGRMLFVDPAYPYTVLHTVAIEDGSLSVLGAEYPRPDQTFAYLSSSSTPITSGWPGHAAFGVKSTYEVSLVTIDASGTPTLHPRFELPLASGFLAGDLNGLAGHGDTLWACVNYSFFGPASGILYLYDVHDLTHPDELEPIRSVSLPVACGSTKVSDDGGRVYVNTSDGIYWFDFPGMDSTENIVVNGPFGANSGLALVGTTLLSRTSTSVVLYDTADHSEVLTIEQDGLIGAAYLPEQQVLVLARREKQDSGYERWLQVYDARADGTGALLDQVLLDIGTVSSSQVVSLGDVVVDSYSKAAFRVVEGKLVHLTTPMLGGVGTLAASAGTPGVWSATSWRALDISEPTQPTWLSPGGPILGRQRALALDIGAQPPLLLDDLGYDGSSSSPRLGRVRTSSSYRQDDDAFVVALRDGKAWAQGTEVGSTLLPGIQTSTLQWSSESLFRIDNPSAGQIRVQRWDQAQLLSSSSTTPREDRTFSLPGMPESTKSTSSTLDFPEQGTLGLVAASYSVSLDGGTSYGAILTWLDRSTPAMAVVEQVPVEGLSYSTLDCRVAQDRAVCLTSKQMILVERHAQPGTAVVHLATLDMAYTGLLAFDGQAIFLSRRDGLEVVPFSTMLNWEPSVGGASADGGASSDAGLPDAVRIPFSSYPLSMIETPNALVISSLYEVVTLQPHCLGR